MIAIESVLFLLGGIILAVLLTQVFGRGLSASKDRPNVRLVRSTRAPDGVEETRLTINDQPILTASSAGQRLAGYADEVERLETIATRIAAALGGSVELARVGPKDAESEAGVPVRDLPTDETELTERRSRQQSVGRM